MKLNRKFLAAAGCAGVLAFAVTGCSGASAQAETKEEVTTEIAAEAATEEESSAESEDTAAESSSEENNSEESEEMGTMITETIRVWGPVLSVEDGSVMIDNQSGISSPGEMILQIAEETRILGAENGFPVELSEIEEGEMIYVNIGPAMTMSLPPQTTAEVIICEVPEDFKAPDYVQVVSMEQAKDDSYVLNASNGETYQVAADCEILPFLTRNIVMLQDVTEGSTVMVWSDAENQVQRLVLFAE